MKPEVHSGSAEELNFRPLTPKDWADFETLFGPRGACAGCWCMWWRVAGGVFEKNKGDGNREAISELVQSGQVPGILAYVGKEPAGWCSIAPREEFPRLNRSPMLKPVDDLSVWSVVCFFINKKYRRRGLTEALLRAAIEYARGQGATVVEGYPVETDKANYPVIGAYTGFASTFRKMGFREVLRRRATRPIMRFEF